MVVPVAASATIETQSGADSFPLTLEFETVSQGVRKAHVLRAVAHGGSLWFEWSSGGHRRTGVTSVIAAVEDTQLLWKGSIAKKTSYRDALAALGIKDAAVKQQHTV